MKTLVAAPSQDVFDQWLREHHREPSETEHVTNVTQLMARDPRAHDVVFIPGWVAGKTSEFCTALLQLADQCDQSRPRARATDPETSHAAAASVRSIKESHTTILNLFKSCGPMTHDELIRLYRNSRAQPEQSDSGIRTRCHELVVNGKLRDTGARETLPTGRKSIVWGVANN